jgi:hypothetical protein
LAYTDIGDAVSSYVIGYFMRFSCTDRALSLDTCWIQIYLHPTTRGRSIKKRVYMALIFPVRMLTDQLASYKVGTELTTDRRVGVSVPDRVPTNKVTAS